MIYLKIALALLLISPTHSWCFGVGTVGVLGSGEVADDSVGYSQLYTDAVVIYDFEDDATDTKGSLSLSACSGTPTYTSTGAPEQDYWTVFDSSSSQCWTHADNDALDIGTNQDYSVSFWMKIDTGGNYIYPFGKHDNSNDLGYAVRYVYDGNVQLQLNHSNTTYPSVSLFETNITDTFHVVIVYDYSETNEITLYVSTLGGTFGDTANGTNLSLDAAPALNSEPFYIGSDRNIAGRYHDGKIDEWVLWKQAITATNAEAIYDGDWR